LGGSPYFGHKNVRVKLLTTRRELLSLLKLKLKLLETLLLPLQENTVSLNKLSTAGDKNIKVSLPPKLNALKLLKLKMLASKNSLPKKNLKFKPLPNSLKKLLTLKEKLIKLIKRAGGSPPGWEG